MEADPILVAPRCMSVMLDVNNARRAARGDFLRSGTLLFHRSRNGRLRIRNK
jgi:hypothetical protein